ncbi:MAG: hypothetical protein ACON5H_02595 [Akkermansiaceae bacterium]
MGVGILLSIPKLPQLLKLEQFLFWRLDAHQEFYERGQNEITVVRPTPVHIDPPEVFLVEGAPSVTDWMLALNTLNEQKASSITITPPLSWTDADELELRALEHEARILPTTLGYDLRLASLPQKFPHHLTPFTLQNISGDLTGIPEVNSLVSPSSITSSTQGFRLLENAQPTVSPDSLTLPLLARWDGKILPSLELATLISHFGASPEEIKVHLGSHIRLNLGAPVIPIDLKGNVTLPRSDKETSTHTFKSLFTSDLNLLPETRVLIRHRTDPAHLRSLDQTLAQLSSRSLAQPFDIARRSLGFEIGLLLLASLLFATRFPFAPLPLAIPPLASTFGFTWFLWTPLLGACLISLVIWRIHSRSASQAKLEKEHPAPSPTKAETTEGRQQRLTKENTPPIKTANKKPSRRRVGKKNSARKLRRKKLKKR